jgi:hypothetical protein
MPELGPYGSVRGALSNERPYRDSGAPVSAEFRANRTAFTRHSASLRTTSIYGDVVGVEERAFAARMW